MSHTQGKLKYFSTEDGLCRINPENGGLIVAECSVRNPFDVEQTENARRLVACWNAFDGALTDDVEAISGMDSFQVAALMQERGALENIACYIGVGGFNGATVHQLEARIKNEFDRINEAQK